MASVRDIVMNEFMEHELRQPQRRTGMAPKDDWYVFSIRLA